MTNVSTCANMVSANKTKGGIMARNKWMEDMYKIPEPKPECWSCNKTFNSVSVKNQHEEECDEWMED